MGGTNVSTSGGAGANSTAMGGTNVSTSGGAGATSVASGGTSGGSIADPPSAGTSGDPPLVVDPAETWGGKPLGMVPYATSGTELWALGYADDGAVFFKTMRDTRLGADCTFEQTEAGEWLCSPTKKQSLIYLDAECTEPASEQAAFTTPTGEVFGLNTTSASPSGGSDTVLVPTHAPVYRVAEEVFKSNGETTFAEETLSIYEGSATQCRGPRIANRHVVVKPPSIFRVAPVADAELVKATIRDIPLKGGFTLERLVTEDGAQLSGHLRVGGKACELQRDGRCVPTPVAEPFLFADADCSEYAFRLANGANTGATLYGVEPIPIDTPQVYELTPTTAVYSTQASSGGCESVDVSNGAFVYYRRGRNVTEELSKLDTVQFGTAGLSPLWFFGVLFDRDARVQIQIHSPEGNWVRPNIRTSNGSVCAVYHPGYEDKCLFMDGVTSLPVVEVKL
jgi:hypothetical protein